MAHSSAQDAPSASISRNRPGGQGRSGAIRGAYGEKERKTKAPQKSVNGIFEARCSTCEALFRPRKRNKSGRVFCSARCRLLFWTAGALLKAYRAGCADGLREVIEELKKL
jgi:hypothetical protein